VAVDTVNSFITLAEARAYLDLEAGDTERDAELEEVINHSARLFNAYCGCQLKSRAYTDLLFDGDGSQTQSLPHGPVDTGQTLTLYADEFREFTAALAIWDGTGSPASKEYMVDAEGWEIIRIDGDNWPVGPKTLKVTMTAGYTASTDGGELKHAQLRQVAAWYHQIGTDPALSSWSLGGVNVSLINVNPTIGRHALFLPDVHAVLHSYRVWSIL